MPSTHTSLPKCNGRSPRTVTTLETVRERQGQGLPGDGKANREAERDLCPWMLRLLSAKPCPHELGAGRTGS